MRAVIDEFPPSGLKKPPRQRSDRFHQTLPPVLDQLDEKLGDDFPLWSVLEKFDRENEFNTELKEYRERHGKATAAIRPSRRPRPGSWSG